MYSTGKSDLQTNKVLKGVNIGFGQDCEHDGRIMVRSTCHDYRINTYMAFPKRRTDKLVVLTFSSVCHKILGWRR